MCVPGIIRCRGTTPLGIYYLFIFPSSYVLSSPFFSLSLLVVTQIRGDIAGSFSPPPSTVRALHVYRTKGSTLSTLVDSRLIVCFVSLVQMCFAQGHMCLVNSFFFFSLLFCEFAVSLRYQFCLTPKDRNFTYYVGCSLFFFSVFAGGVCCC